MKKLPKPIFRKGHTLYEAGEHVIVIRPDKSSTKVLNCRLTEETADRIILEAGKPVEYR